MKLWLLRNKRQTGITLGVFRIDEVRNTVLFALLVKKRFGVHPNPSITAMDRNFGK